eukprot:gene11375-9887_t
MPEQESPAGPAGPTAPAFTIHHPFSYSRQIIHRCRDFTPAEELKVAALSPARSRAPPHPMYT